MKFNEYKLEIEIRNAEQKLNEFGDEFISFWKFIKIQPLLWKCDQYVKGNTEWVIAVMGNKYLYYNFVEGGWGWGKFLNWGVIHEYHCNQEEIQHVISLMLNCIVDKEKGEE